MEEDNQYKKKLGQYRPHFQGKPEDYYELSCGDVVSAISLCTFILVVNFFIAYGFFVWTATRETSNFVLVWSIIVCILIPLFIIFAFVGSRNKAQIQSRLIKEALQRENRKKPSTKKTKGDRLNQQSFETFGEFNEEGL